MTTPSHSSLPVAITMGDPSGVGAEVIVKALAQYDEETRKKIIIVGDRAILDRASKVCGVTVPFHDWKQAGEEGSTALCQITVSDLPEGFGVLSSACGEAAFQYINQAVKMTQAGETAGIVTAPINKEALNSAGHHYDGHTGMLQALTKADSSFMLLASKRLKVIHVSTHVALSEAINRAKTERVLETIRAGHEHLKRLGFEKPRIAVAGLNPHCGEGGLFGSEDTDQLAPAVAQARAEGMDVYGPIPADTVFYRAYNDAFDLVIAQYHDQGHIAIKLVAFDTAVNVSLGLPIDRTSVDHGTAFDIAGTGKANHGNLLEAVEYALKLAESKTTAA